MAGKQLLANNAKGTLLAGIIAGDTQLTLGAGQGAKFPAPAGTDWFKATLIKGDGSIEIIKCTARAVDTFNPIVRAQEGTVALAFNAGDKVELRWTRDTANQFQQRTDVQTNLARFLGVVGGTSDALTGTIASDLTALVDGLSVDAEGASANGTTTPTLNLTLGTTATGAKTIKKFAGSPMSAGDIAGPGHRLMFEYRAADDAWYLLNPAGALSRALIAVRHAIQMCKQDANGYNSAFAAGTGLAVDLSAAATPMNISFANGFDSQGPFELVSQLTADAASAISSIAASNTTFLHATWSSLSAVTWGKCLVPPQYGYVFDRTQGALLNFEGLNGAAATTDDFGNAVTLTGATISTAQFKYGASSLDCTGGTAKSVKIAGATSLGGGSWEASVWFRLNALPTAGNNGALFIAENATSFGARLFINNNAGTVKLMVVLSGDGTTASIAASVVGTNTVWTLNQWNKVRMVFDALAGTYKVFLSLNGGAESTDITVSSSVRICSIVDIYSGRDVPTASHQLDGWLDALRFLRCVTNTSAETPSASAPTITDYPVHFFNIPQMKMYEVTGANALPTGDPVLTQRNRVFAGEVDTGAAAVSAVRNYALRGRYRSLGFDSPGSGNSQNLADNIGTFYKKARLRVQLMTNNNNDVVQTEHEAFTYQNSSPAEYCFQPMTYQRCNTLVACSTGGYLFCSATGAAIGITAADTRFKFYVEAERAF